MTDFPNEYKEFLNQIQKDERSFESTTVQCGIIGVTGGGKSSLINAIAGKEIAEVGVTETTGVSAEISAYEFQNIVLIDLPGVGTTKWPTETYFSKLEKHCTLNEKYSLRAENFDFFILVIANRLLEEDLNLYKLITHDLKKQCFLVRSKFDIDANNNFRTKNQSDQETYNEIIEDLWRNFPNEIRETVFVISTAEPWRGDFEALVEAITQSLPELKSEKFIAYATGHSKKFLKKKRKIAEKHASRLALLSAGNALNPIPGLSVAVDISILMKLSNDLLEIYGLTEEQLSFEIRHNVEGDAWGIAFKHRTSEMFTNFLSKKGIIIVLERVAPAIEIKEVAKWFPFAGQAIGALIGYKLTASFAQEIIDKYESQALILAESMFPRCRSEQSDLLNRP